MTPASLMVSPRGPLLTISLAVSLALGTMCAGVLILPLLMILNDAPSVQRNGAAALLGTYQMALWTLPLTALVLQRERPRLALAAQIGWGVLMLPLVALLIRSASF